MARTSISKPSSRCDCTLLGVLYLEASDSQGKCKPLDETVGPVQKRESCKEECKVENFALGAGCVLEASDELMSVNSS